MFRSLWNPPEITGKCYPRMQAFGYGFSFSSSLDKAPRALGSRCSNTQTSSRTEEAGRRLRATMGRVLSPVTP